MTKLPNPPLDCISRVRFAPAEGNCQFLAASWDGTVRLYDAGTQRLLGQHKQPLPVLDAAFFEDSLKCVAAGLSKKIILSDFCSHRDTCIGEHREAVKCLEYDSEHRQILSASWDKMLCAWDSRRPGEASASAKLGAKAFSMDAKGNKVIVGASDRCLHVFDLRKLSQRMEKLESLLKVQLRCVKIGPDEHHAAVGSDEGRVALEPLCRSRPPGDSVRYAFKCHRTKTDGKEVAHQVNAIAFHPAYATFATGGGDGSTCFWDGFARKRLAKLGPFSTSVSSLDFSADGALLAVAVSYAFEEGERCPPPVPSLFVRAVEPADVRPKEG
ncbi:BUB3.1 [Symbiodinium sp. CCMP2592]|nr:BUB3.1 [Symbiodinium sp. CCMP2592]